MWFKQCRLFQLTDSLRASLDNLAGKLEELAFRPCRPSMPFSVGWVSPIDEDDMPLVQAINGYMMICFQIEEKILPAVVIRQELNKKIKEIEKSQDRKIGQKEKYALKDEIIVTLLPRAFSKLIRVYAYIDTKNNWLILGTNNEQKAEQFISLFKKSMGKDIHPFEIKTLSYTLTQWLTRQNYPSSFSIEKSCLLQDPNKENRTVRCQEQDLFASGIQSLIKEGCEVKQLALGWQDRVNMVLSDDFSLSGIKFHDEITSQSEDMEAGSANQKFHADFLIMSETLSKLFKDLTNVFIESNKSDGGKIIPMTKLALAN